MGKTPATFAGLDDLIRMKEAAGRPKDIDLREQRSGCQLFMPSYNEACNFALKVLNISRAVFSLIVVISKNSNASL